MDSLLDNDTTGARGRSPCPLLRNSSPQRRFRPAGVNPGRNLARTVFLSDEKSLYHRNLTELRFELAFFALINEQGLSWDSKLPMRDQKGWKEHAAFMDALADEKFIVLGGPLKKRSRHRTLLIFDATDEETIRARMAADPWIRDGTLRIIDIYKWEILLGGLKNRSD